MRKLALAAFADSLSLAGIVAAQAADLPVKARPAPPAPIFSWTGFYIGGHAGALHGRSALDEVNGVFFPGFVTNGGIPALAPIVLVPSRFSNLGGVGGRSTDVMAGGQLGYNWQADRFLFGLEGDANWTNLRIGVNQNAIDPFAIQTLTGTYSTRLDWTASIRGRLGLTFDRVLLYATGGVAFAGGQFNSTFTLANPITGIFFPTPFAGTTAASSSFSKVGWTIGAGVEWAFTDNWSIAGEYRHTDYGRVGVTFANTDPAAATDGLGIVSASTRNRLTTDQATLRLNYRFGGPIVARY